MRYAIDGKYPVETKEQLEKTATYFDKFLPRFHPKDRIKIASVMSKRASELGVCLDRDWVNNYSRATSDVSGSSYLFGMKIKDIVYLTTQTIFIKMPKKKNFHNNIKD
jgi:hypothetical protein